MTDWADDRASQVSAAWIKDDRFPPRLEDHLAQALRDEREACAKVAETRDERGTPEQLHGAYIARAIRNQNNGDLR